jgi:hypothetical protein
MTKLDPKDFFVTALNSRMAAVKKALSNAVHALLDNSPQARASSLQTFIRELELLRDFLDSSQHPQWIGDALTQAKRALAHVNANGEESNFVLATILCPAIMSHEWHFPDTNIELGFDFDSIYKRHKTECQVPELFDALIASIEVLLQDPVMDSRNAERELNRIIATLKKAKRGDSFVQTVLSLNFASSFLQHLVKEYSEKSTLGPAIKAYRKALEETQAAMDEATVKVQADVDAQLRFAVPRLPPSWPRITMRDDSEGSE